MFKRLKSLGSTLYNRTGVKRAYTAATEETPKDRLFVQGLQSSLKKVLKAPAPNK